MHAGRRRILAGALACVALSGATSLPAQTTGAALVEEVRSKIADALRYRDLASKAFVAGSFEAGCTHLESAQSVYGAAVTLANRGANDISAPNQARAAMRAIAADAMFDQGTMRSEHYRRCTVELTPEERERQLAERVARTEFLADLIESSEMKETLWSRMNRGGGVKDPTAVRQFIAVAGYHPKYGEPARRLLAKLEAERARSPLKPARPDPKELRDADVLPAAGKTFRDCAECPAMVSIDDGPKEVGYGGSTFRITLEKRIAIGVTEVTRGEWRACVAAEACSSTPLDDDALRRGEDDHPVSRVTYDDAERYAAWITRQSAHDYGIPTELEWEAAGAGVTREHGFYNGTNYGGDKKGTDVYLLSSPVRFFGVDRNGTFDMIGNVAEWTDGCFNRQYDRTQTDGHRRRDGDCSKASVKGGAFVFLDGIPQVPGCAPIATDQRHPAVGLRLIRRQSRDYAAAATPTAAPAVRAQPSPARAATAAPAMEQRRDLVTRLGITMVAKELALRLPTYHPGYEVQYNPVEANGLKCAVAMQAWAGGSDPDGIWRPRAESPRAQMIRNRGFSPAFDALEIDGAIVYSYIGSVSVFHVRVTPDRPLLTVQCDEVPEDRSAEALRIAESIRWPGEPVEGKRRYPANELPSSSPLVDPVMMGRVSRLTPEMLAFEEPAGDRAANYPTIGRVGITARLPGLDWAIVPLKTALMIRRLPDGVVCNVMEGKEWSLGDLAGPMSNDPNVTRVGEAKNFTDASTAAVVVDAVPVRRGSSWEYDEVIMRYVLGKPTLVIACSPGYDKEVPGVAAVTKALAASVRWGDEPPGAPSAGAASAPPARP